MNLPTIATHLDTYLRLAEVPDYDGAVNGLQVENAGDIHRVVAAVDASQAAIDHAVARGPGTLLLVHHGLFWDGNRPVTGRRYRRLAAAIRGDVAVYAAHLPLDAHPEVGNNAVLARELGLEPDGGFGEYKGTVIGLAGPLALPRQELVTRLEQLLGGPVTLIPGGPETTARVGIISGGAGTSVLAARAAGCDTFITGEGAHHTWFDAMEGGVNLLYAGHYATETVGVKALAAHLAERFGLPWEFFDLPTGM